MDIDPPVPPDPKKVPRSTKEPKFTPKPPVRRKPASVLPKRDSSDDDAEIKQKLLGKVNERLSSRGPKLEKKSSGNVATSHGAGSSTAHDQKKDENSKNNSDLTESSEKCVMFSSSIDTKDKNIDNILVDDESGYSSNSENEYKEPWSQDSHSYYPISLPLRLPGSGDPEVLNVQEFGEEKEYDETKLNSALELGLLENKEQKQLIFFLFPEKLPLGQPTHLVAVSSEGKEKVERLSPLKKDAGLKDLPVGYMGKMLVFKSGAIKLKLGDIIFDVSSGTPCGCHQSAAIMNTNSKNYFVLGPVNKKAVVTPDLVSIMDNIDQP